MKPQINRSIRCLHRYRLGRSKTRHLLAGHWCQCAGVYDADPAPGSIGASWPSALRKPGLRTYEGLIKQIEMDTAESDVIVERLDGTKAYLEVFCVMPDFPLPENGKIVIWDVKTHTQTEMASIRQKLLRKISKQKQLSKPRENYAVIELNDSVIAGDCSVLSSLSSGYTVTINKETRKIESSGYNWANSIFDDESTKFLKAVIYFDLGGYEPRKYLFNPNFYSGDTPNYGFEVQAR